MPPSPRVQPLRQIVNLILLLVITLSWYPATSMAEDISTESVIDRVHGNMSIRLSDFVGRIDSFFGEDEESPRVNESFVRLRFQGTYLEKDSFDPKANLKLKLILPSTEERLRLLISADEDDTTEPGSSSASTNSDDTDGDLSLALRFLRTARENSGIKFDLGTRVRDSKLLAFARIGGFTRAQLSEDWRGTLANNALFYSDSGYDNRLSFKFERSLSFTREALLLSTTQFRWVDDSKGASIQQVAGLYSNYSPKTSLALEGLLSYTTAPASGVKRFDGGGLRFRIRQNAFRHWFFYEIWPGLNWLAERDYEMTYGLLIRVEAVIGRQEKQ